MVKTIEQNCPDLGMHPADFEILADWCSMGHIPSMRRMMQHFDSLISSEGKEHLHALGAEALTRRRIAAFDVEYDREVRIGEKVRTALSRDGETFSFCGFMQDGTRCFGIRGGLAEI